jgi:succinyl-CoA synthetase beta subunit
MKLYEFEGKTLFQKAGIPVPRGTVVATVEEARKAASTIGYPVVVKAQLLRGRRGKAGLIRFAEDEETLSGETSALLSMEAEGEKIDKILVEEKIPKARELYAGITFDPERLLPLLMISTEGGVDIEDIAHDRPERFFTKTLSPLRMPSLARIVDLVLRTGFRGEELLQVANVILKLVQAYFRFEAITVEVNPLMITETQGVFAADAKFEIDDSGLGRIQEAETFIRLEKLVDPLEMEAKREDIAYVRMPEGNIGLISGGAGLGMATMDMISVHGGSPANFLDLGGNATEEKTAAALRIVLKTPGVEGILMNAFGGINNCERMAKGIVRALDGLRPQQAIVVKMRGHSQEGGWALLESRQIPVVKFGTTEEAVILLMEKMKEKGEGLRGHTG